MSVRRLTPAQLAAALPSGLPVPSEHDEQAALIEWAALHEREDVRLAMLCAIPNGGARSKRTAGRLKAEGVRRGVPDLALLAPGNGGAALFIELKRVRRGYATPEQRMMLDRLRAYGFRAEVARGWVSAAMIIADYLMLPLSTVPDR